MKESHGKLQGYMYLDFLRSSDRKDRMRETAPRLHSLENITCVGSFGIQVDEVRCLGYPRLAQR